MDPDPTGNGPTDHEVTDDDVTDDEVTDDEVTDELVAADPDDDDLDDLIHRADLDGLVRMIDDRCATRDWDGLLRIRNRSRHAVVTGRQLWPAATLAEYRLALLGEPRFVAAVLDESDGLSGRFTIGPLTEVAAQSHSWSDLRGHLERGPRASFVAHERLLRGEAIEADDLPGVLELPLHIGDWEPDYALATYSQSGAEFPMPELPERWVDLDPRHDATPLDDDVELAVRQLVEPWTTSSDGRVDVVCVEGDRATAIGALGVRHARACPLTAAQAVAWIAWAGASGGAHGRRRGAAAGRFGAWWLLGALGDVLDEWPISTERMGEIATGLEFWRWNAHEPTSGWELQLAIEDRTEGVAWALSARDAA